MAGYAQKRMLSLNCAKRRPQIAHGAAARLGTFIVFIGLVILSAGTPASSFSHPVLTQQAHSAQIPVIVQPGAPGKPSKTLSPSTKATLPPPSPADVEFM